MKVRHRDVREDARPVGSRRAASEDEQLYDRINVSDQVYTITHPQCHDCGALMILLDVGKLCPACGRLALAGDHWKATHPKYSRVPSIRGGKKCQA